MAKKVINIGTLPGDGTGDPWRDAMDKANDNFDELYTAEALNTAKTTNATHTGDATGGTALTLATVNANVGSFTKANITVNAKGLITAAATGTDDVTLTGVQTLTNKTLTSPKINEDVALTPTSTELNYVDGATSNIQAQINAKQDTLISGTNIKTVGGTSVLGSGNIPIAGTGTVTSVAITTANGVSASITDPTGAADMTIALGAITPASVAAVGTVGGSNLSGTNTGDNATNTQYSGLVSNATHTGDATGSTALTVVKINGTLMSGLTTGLLKNTTGTGVPSIASPGTDYVVPSGSITGNAATATKLAATKTINGIAFDGSANITIPSNITPSTSGNVLTSNGSVWTSAAPLVQKYASLVTLIAGVELAKTTTIPDTAEIYAFSLLDSSLTNISDLILSFTRVGGFYIVHMYSVDALTDCKLKILY